MRRSRTVGALGVAVVLFGGLFLARCGSPAAPTLQADVVSSGTITGVGCFNGGSNLFTCSSFSGPMQNTGAGCASNIHGVTLTFVAGTTTQVGSADWTFTGTLQPGQIGTYVGGAITLPGPLVGGWTYGTQIEFTSVACS
jgi:hypothetical protein